MLSPNACLPVKTETACISLPYALPLLGPMFLLCPTLLLCPKLCCYFSVSVGASAHGSHRSRARLVPVLWWACVSHFILGRGKTSHFSPSETCHIVCHLGPLPAPWPPLYLWKVETMTLLGCYLQVRWCGLRWYTAFWPHYPWDPWNPNPFSTLVTVFTVAVARESLLCGS